MANQLIELQNLPASIFGNVYVGANSLGPGAVTAPALGAGAVTSLAIGPGAVSPDQMGITVWNATGSPLTAGQLVFISGWNTANALLQVSLSVNNLKGQEAQYIVPAAIANGAAGVVRRHWLSAATLNTGGGSVGDPVYLDSVAGGWTVTPPAGAATRQQVIGRIVVISATVGQIDFNTDSAGILSTVGTQDLEAGAVTGTQASQPMSTRLLQSSLPTVATTGTTEVLLMVPDGGTVIGAFYVFKDALAQDATNWARVQIVNKTQSNALVLANTDANTTKTATGAALAAYGLRIGALGTGAVLALNGGDTLAVQVISNATLANTLTEGAVMLKLQVPT